MSHPARGAWIEIVVLFDCKTCELSHPARGAWIEILHALAVIDVLRVAPRKGCVD